MKPPDKPAPVFEPQWSPNLIVGYNFVHHALVAVSEAFMNPPAPAPEASAP